MLHPGEIGVAARGHAVNPALILRQQIAAPVADVEGWIGQDIVRFQIGVQIVVEGVRGVGADIALDAADGQVHLEQLPGRGVRFLAVDGDIAQPPLVIFDEALRLHEHASRAAAGIVNSAPFRLQHLHQQGDDRLRRVKFAPFLALGAGELAQEIFVNPAQDVPRPAGRIPQADRADEVDQFAQAALIQLFTAVILGQHPFQPRILLLDGRHGLIDQDADLRALGPRLQLPPARCLRHPEDILHQVFVAIFGVGVRRLLPGAQIIVQFLEGVGDIFEEDQAQDDMFIFGRVQVAAQLIGRSPQRLL